MFEKRMQFTYYDYSVHIRDLIKNIKMDIFTLIFDAKLVVCD